jgi:hypothetical protein
MNLFRRHHRLSLEKENACRLTVLVEERDSLEQEFRKLKNEFESVKRKFEMTTLKKEKRTIDKMR